MGCGTLRANPKFAKEHEFESSASLGVIRTTELLAILVPALLRGSFVVRPEKIVNNKIMSY